MKATARAHPNIAFIKYWGNRDDALKIPANGSISMNLDGMYTETTVQWGSERDTLVLNGEHTSGPALERVIRHLDAIRRAVQISSRAVVETHNNFPMGVGIASSASSFAALTLAAVSAAGFSLTEAAISAIARLGSGSAARSIPDGFVEWHQGYDHETSFAQTFASRDHWRLIDVIAVVSSEHKKTGSEAGHTTAGTSPLQAARVSDAQRRLNICREALLSRNFTTLADVVELDSNMMHAVMMTSNPRLLYWLPASLSVMLAVQKWRRDGLNVCYTLDAGPNVHCICTEEDSETVATLLQQIPTILEVRKAAPGQGAHLLG